MLVLATGTSHSYFGNDEWEAHAPGLKTIEDALEIRRRVLLAFERAERDADPAERRRDLTFVVVGGGPTGVETAGAIAEIAFKTFRSEFRADRPGHGHGDPARGNRAGARHLSRLAVAQGGTPAPRLGVDVRLGVTVTDIDDDGVVTTRAPVGTIRARTVIWAAGNPPHRSPRCSTAPPTAPAVSSSTAICRSRDRHIFAVGDIAHADLRRATTCRASRKERSRAEPRRRGDPRRPRRRPRPTFAYQNKGELATIGRSSAVGTIGRLSGSRGGSRGWHGGRSTSCSSSTSAAGSA